MERPLRTYPTQKSKKGAPGFTLIKLMIEVPILWILSAIAIPQFALMIAKPQEGVSKANLGAIRSAVAIYYSDNEGVYAKTLNALVSKYIFIIPNAISPSLG